VKGSVSDPADLDRLYAAVNPVRNRARKIAMNVLAVMSSLELR
jgi:hypothetical protein